MDQVSPLRWYEHCIFVDLLKINSGIDDEDLLNVLWVGGGENYKSQYKIFIKRVEHMFEVTVIKVVGQWPKLGLYKYVLYSHVWMFID